MMGLHFAWPGLHFAWPGLYVVIPTGAGAPATAEWRNLLFLCGGTNLAGTVSDPSIRAQTRLRPLTTLILSSQTLGGTALRAAIKT
jgi:hypothetical protein